MKKLIVAVLTLAFASSVPFAFAADAATPETKKVCHVDAKTKKEKCKQVKVHKMHEGTPVPEKAPAKKKK